MRQLKITKQVVQREIPSYLQEMVKAPAEQEV